MPKNSFEFRGEIAGVEEGEPFLLLHLNVYKWNKSIYKEIKMAVIDFIIEAGQRDLGAVAFIVDEENEKTVKFAKMLLPLDFEYRNDGLISGGWFTEKVA